MCGSPSHAQNTTMFSFCTQIKILALLTYQSLHHMIKFLYIFYSSPSIFSIFDSNPWPHRTIYLKHWPYQILNSVEDLLPSEVEGTLDHCLIVGGSQPHVALLFSFSNYYTTIFKLIITHTAWSWNQRPFYVTIFPFLQLRVHSGSSLLYI